MKRCENARPKRAKLPVEEEKRRRKALKSLHTFVQEFWPEIEPKTFVDGWHIVAICLHLMAVTFSIIKRLLINVPPRHCKSLLVSVFWPAWEFARGDRNGWLFVSGGKDLSIRDSVRFRRIIESDKFKRWFPDCVSTSDQNTKEKIDFDRGGFREATSTGSKVTGKGGGRIVVDDIHDARAGDEEIRKDVKWRREVLTSRENDPDETAWVIIMQRLHEDDLSGWTIANLDYVHLNLPWHYDPERHCKTPIWEDPRMEAGEILWPNRFREEHYARWVAGMGTLAAAGQLEQNPRPADGTEFKAQWMNHRFNRLMGFRVEMWLISVDASFKNKISSDYVVFQLWAKVGAQYFCVAQIRDRMNYPTMRTRLREWRESWIGKGIWPDLIVIEDKANGSALLAELIIDVEGVVPFEPRDSKEVRWRAVSGQWEAGQIALPEKGAVIVNTAGEVIHLSTDWVSDFVEEHLKVPAAKNDDQVDCSTQALLAFRQRFGVVVAGQAVGEVCVLYDPEGLDFGYRL